MTAPADRSPELVTVLIPNVVHGANVPHMLRSGTINVNLPCECGKIVNVTLFVVGDPPFKARGIPCTCGRTMTMEYDGPADPALGIHYREPA